MQQLHDGSSTSFPRRLWSVSWKLVLFVGLFLALYIPFILPFLKFPETEYATIETAFGRMQIEMLAMVTVILAALAMTRYVDRRPLATIGLTRPRAILYLCGGTLLGCLMLFLAIVVLAAFGFVQYGDGFGPLNAEVFWSCIALLFNVVNQEVMIHGYAQQVVRAKFGSSAAVIGSSCLFVLVHWTLFSLDSMLLLSNLFVAGAMLGIVFLASRSLWLPIGIHFGWNLAQGPILGLPVTSVDIWPSDLVNLTGAEIMTGGNFGVEGGIVGSVVLLGTSVWFYRKWRAQLAANRDLENTLP